MTFEILRAVVDDTVLSIATVVGAFTELAKTTLTNTCSVRTVFTFFTVFCGGATTTWDTASIFTTLAVCVTVSVCFAFVFTEVLLTEAVAATVLVFATRCTAVVHTDTAFGVAITVFVARGEACSAITVVFVWAVTICRAFSATTTITNEPCGAVGALSAGVGGDGVGVAEGFSVIFCEVRFGVVGGRHDGVCCGRVSKSNRVADFVGEDHHLCFVRACACFEPHVTFFDGTTSAPDRAAQSYGRSRRAVWQRGNPFDHIDTITFDRADLCGPHVFEHHERAVDLLPSVKSVLDNFFDVSEITPTPVGFVRVCDVPGDRHF